MLLDIIWRLWHIHRCRSLNWQLARPEAYVTKCFRNIAAQMFLKQLAAGCVLGKAESGQNLVLCKCSSRISITVRLIPFVTVACRLLFHLLNMPPELLFILMIL